MQDAQAESGGLRAQLGAEQDMNRDLQERIRTLEADLIKEAERTFDAEEGDGELVVVEVLMISTGCGVLWQCQHHLTLLRYTCQ